MKKIIFAISALAAAMGSAQAQNQSAAPLHFLAGAGYTVGGDDLATARYTNGGSQDIKAGQGLYLTIGADYRVSPAFSIQGTLNFHVDDTNASNGSIKFHRYPVEVLGYYHVNQQWRVGGGVRYVNSAKLSSNGAASGLETKFDSTTSGVLEAEYFWTSQVGMKMRYVKESFKGAGYRDVKADHAGLSINYYF